MLSLVRRVGNAGCVSTRVMSCAGTLQYCREPRDGSSAVPVLRTHVVAGRVQVLHCGIHAVQVVCSPQHIDRAKEDTGVNMSMENSVSNTIYTKEYRYVEKFQLNPLAQPENAMHQTPLTHNQDGNPSKYQNQSGCMAYPHPARFPPPNKNPTHHTPASTHSYRRAYPESHSCAP